MTLEHWQYEDRAVLGKRLRVRDSILDEIFVHMFYCVHQLDRSAE